MDAIECFKKHSQMFDKKGNLVQKKINLRTKSKLDLAIICPPDTCLRMLLRFLFKAAPFVQKREVLFYYDRRLLSLTSIAYSFSSKC